MPEGMDATEDAAMRRVSRARDALIVARRATYFNPSSFLSLGASTFATL
jgi:hypothetical protein